jgi:hypothetical protein
LEHTRAYSGKPQRNEAVMGNNTMSRPWIALAFLLLAVLATLAGCRRTPDEEQVRKAIAATVAGAEAGKASDTVEALTDDFDGNAGQLDKRSLANLVRVYALRGQAIHILMGPMNVEPRGDRMVATFTVTLTAGAGVLPDDAGAYRVETGWRKDDGAWRCFTATWKKAL